MLPKRTSKLLSGEEVINSKNSSLKDIPSGCKEYAPNNSWLEKKQIQVILETHHSLVGSERIEKKSNLSSAIWLSNVGKAKVTKKAGKIWEVFGHTIDSEDWLLPEEALFLLETSALELFRDDVPLSIEETYTLVVGEHCTLEEYRVYSHLSRKGFRVLRHDKEITLTAYEKNIHLDQISLAEKRCPPSTAVTAKSVGNVSDKEGRKSIAEDVATSVPEVEVTQTEASKKAALSTEGETLGVESSALSVADEANDIAAGAPVVESAPPEEVEMAEIGAGSKAETVKSPAASSVTDKAIIIVSATEPEGDLIIDEGPEESVCVESGSESLKPPESSVGDGSKDIEPMPADRPNADSTPVVVVEISSLNVKEQENVKTRDEPLAKASEMVPLKKRVGSSPDLYIVDDVQHDDIIEIDDEENDILEVEITEVKTASQMDTVDLVDSEEDDDVVFICQKSGNTDPTKWRKWFLTIPDFVNATLPEQLDPSGENKKPTKLKLIDLFDLENKTIDTIMKAIPSHDGSVRFINAPDLRFIPHNIVPKCAHYRINVQSYDDRDSVSRSSRSPAGRPNVDTSRSLSEVVQYGQEPANFSRNPYGYSFHRTRNNNYRNYPWNSRGSSHSNYQNRSNSFQRQNPPFRPNRFIPSDQNQDRPSPATVINEGHNDQNNFSRNEDSENRTFYNNSNAQNFGRPNNFRYPWNNNQTNFQNNFTDNLNPGQSGGFQYPFGLQGQLKHALQQACQMQLLAMSLMQNSQALIQTSCGTSNLFQNPQMNLNFNPMNNFPMNNFKPANNFNPMNNFSNLNVGNPFMNQFNNDFRDRRPYRRPYMRRGYGGRRRYYNDRVSPNVTEIVCIDSEEEDSKDLTKKPAYKRVLALGAIADLNSPKRTKVIEISEVAEVKSERSVKKETRRSPLKSKATPVKTEQTPAKTERMDGDVCEVKPVINSKVPSESNQPIVYIVDDVTNSPPLVVVDDDSRSDPGAIIDSTIAVAPELSEVSVDEEVETDVVMKENLNENDSTIVEDVATTSDREAVPESWQSYKQDLAENHSELPSQPKTFSSLLSYDDQRAGVKDVLKSLQILGPIDETETTEKLKVSFDIYLPNQPFRKSVRLLPNYRVIVSDPTYFPSAFQLNYLEQTYRDGVPFLFAVVYDDSVGLYNLHSPTLPTLTENV